MLTRTRPPLKRLCDERGLKYMWLARQLGVTHRASFDQMLNGTRRTPPFFYEKAAALLNVPLSAVLPDEEPEATA
jgi:hypothetical protein